MKDLLDRRLERATGNYATREELVREIIKQARSKVTHGAISKAVGISQATVSRIIAGDEPAYQKIYDDIVELPSRRLDRIWAPTQVPEEEDDDNTNP